MLKRFLIVFVAALALAPSALASGGNYVFAGGTKAEQAQVKAALDASSFNFSVVPNQITIQIAKGLHSDAIPGTIQLDASLLDAGRFSWGVVQHEYAHQVDFFVLTDAQRAQIQSLLGGSAWCAGAAHAALTCERFADLLSWAYWQNGDNCMRPASATDEGGQASPADFRALMSQLVPSPPVRVASALSVKPPRKR